MKKKIVTLLLISLMGLSVVACGGSGNDANGTNSESVATDSEETSADSSEDIIEKEAIYGSYVEQSTGLPLKIDDNRITTLSSPNRFWHGNSEYSCGYKKEGNTFIAEESKEGWGSFDIKPYGSGYSISNDTYTFIPFDDYYKFENTTINTVSTPASCERASITITDVEFSDSVDILNYASEAFVNSFKDEYITEAEEGKCFVKLHIKFDNEGKEAFDVSEDWSVALVYDTSYVFNSFETKGNSVVLEPTNYCYVKGDSASLGGDLNISPLCSVECVVNMLCPSALEENTDKPLYAVFYIKSENEIPTSLVFDLRTASTSSSDTVEEEVSIEDIDAALQGAWSLGNQATFYYDNGDFSMDANGDIYSGTYEVNPETSQIDGHVTAEDGIVNMHINYMYSDGQLILYNNNNVQLDKQ